MAVFTCPECGHSQAVDDKHIGKNATCPKCKSQGPVEKLGDTYTGRNDVSAEMPSVRRCQGKPYGLAGLLRNKESTLTHEWIVIDDPQMPVRMTDVWGVTPTYDLEGSNEYHRSYHYKAPYEWETKDTAVSAVEVRFLTFDVWGGHVRTLTATVIRDVEAHSKTSEVGVWSLYSENEAWEHGASLGYIARVRTAVGKVTVANIDLVVREAQRFSEKFTEADLEPKAPKKN